MIRFYMNIKINKLRNFFFKPKNSTYPKDINYRFNGMLDDEDIYLVSRAGDDKPANIDTCPPDFRILGSDTEIYIFDRGRK